MGGGIAASKYRHALSPSILGKPSRKPVSCGLGLKRSQSTDPPHSRSPSPSPSWINRREQREAIGHISPLPKRRYIEIALFTGISCTLSGPRPGTTSDELCTSAELFPTASREVPMGK